MTDRGEGEQEKSRQFKIPWSPDIHFSSPIAGAPPVSWRHGSTPEIIIEMRTDPQDQPLRRLMGFFSGEFKTCVIYRRDRPHIRALFELGDLKAGERQEIVRGRVEWDRLVTRQELRQAIDLVEEFANIDQRGRPRGTGRPKRKPSEIMGLSADGYLESERIGLTKRQIWVLASWSRGKTKAQIARELRISASAVGRLLLRAEKKSQKKNPNFSLFKFKTAPEPEHAGTGQRWNKRKMDQDKSGRPYVRDSKKLID